MKCTFPLDPGVAVFPMVCEYKQGKMLRDEGRTFQLIDLSCKRQQFSKQTALLYSQAHCS